MIIFLQTMWYKEKGRLYFSNSDRKVVNRTTVLNILWTFCTPGFKPFRYSD